MRLIKYNVFGDTFQNYAPTITLYYDYLHYTMKFHNQEKI
jgi:hypothetical protein